MRVRIETEWREFEQEYVGTVYKVDAEGQIVNRVALAYFNDSIEADVWQDCERWMAERAYELDSFQRSTDWIER